MITLKVNIAMNGYKTGDKIKLETDKQGNILNSFWSRRLKDAKQDNCVEVVEENKKKGSK